MSAATALHAIRPHMLAALVMFMLIGSMIVQPDENVRILTVIPVLGACFAFMVLYVLEVDAIAKAAPVPHRNDARTEIQRMAGELAGINGVPVHERHAHLRAIEFPVQQPRLADQGTYDYWHGRSH
ncbi:MAG: hypothetical protein V1787_06785 [Candidatus Micrarchaeota archaeon]